MALHGSSPQSPLPRPLCWALNNPRERLQSSLEFRGPGTLEVPLHGSRDSGGHGDCAAFSQHSALGRATRRARGGRVLPYRTGKYGLIIQTGDWDVPTLTSGHQDPRVWPTAPCLHMPRVTGSSCGLTPRSPPALRGNPEKSVQLLSSPNGSSRSGKQTSGSQGTREARGQLRGRQCGPTATSGVPRRHPHLSGC